MILRLLLLAGLVLGVSCSRTSHAGVYETIGDTSRFQMVLELKEGGAAKLSTRTKLGDEKLDQSVQTVMTLPNGRWEKVGEQIVVTGARGDGKASTYRFALQGTGDLVWTENGARFVKARTKP